MKTNEHNAQASALAGAGFVLVARCSSIDETRACGAALAQAARSGTVVALQGDLGAGKTHFTQGVAAGLGVDAGVTSPTFNLLVSYEGGRLPLFHFDLYRLEDVRELEDLGYYDVLDAQGVCCIEWSERFPSALPDDRLTVAVLRNSNEGDERQIWARAEGLLHKGILADWQKLLATGALDGSEAAGPASCSIAKPGVGAEAGVAAASPSSRLSAKEGGLSVDAVSDSAEGVGSSAGGLGPALEAPCERDFVLAIDTANEIIAVGLGKLNRSSKTIEFAADKQTPAFRASNTKLLACIEELLAHQSIDKRALACIVCGRGPGSFTGVRICMAAAKGLAMGAGLPLYGVSTLDAQAWQAWDGGYRGQLVVVGDAMRKEVYPVSYQLGDAGPVRLNPDKVRKAAVAADELGAGAEGRLITGDALKKYADIFSSCGSLAKEDAWMPTGKGLLMCTQALWDKGAFDPDDANLGNPLTLLPVYTRLSDAEEHERQRFAVADEKDLSSGVQGGVVRSFNGSATADSHDVEESAFLRYQPLEALWCGEVARLESELMGTDAWNAAQVADELGRADRSWWACFAVANPDARAVSADAARLVGYAGGWIIDGQLQILKIASDPGMRRQGIARELLARLASDARDLGATEATLEVRASNVGAHRFYEALGLTKIGKRPRYYSDREDAFIFTGPLPVAEHDVAGMGLLVNEASSTQDELRHAAEHPEGAASPASVSAEAPAASVAVPAGLPDTLILAIESSCDETAVALVDGAGTIVADVVASQIDFHSRFGGVVPEIASRKHIEAIGGVVEECMRQGALRLGLPSLAFGDLSAIGVTYAPGLLGALVVGVAYAKALAWGAGVPLVGVNHLEGHLYANKIACPDIKPPMVVSLVSGGHTMLVHVEDWGSYHTLGETLDDAVGEAFDKVAKAMGLGYPGGPLISALAKDGDARAIRFPRAMLHSGDFAFSLSGLKTAVMTYLQKEEKAGRAINKADVAASFEAAVVDVQLAKAKRALELTGAKEFCLGGGVAANPALRAGYTKMCADMGVRLTMPPMKACTDNASMIGLVALDRYRQGKFMGIDADAKAHVSLDEPY
ncbi:MAG: tRNA (adenosine(37)-N6)-threonylcarbamoyltransferase complex transferase subunit TsaD [Coriobacteriia bacterium]|nr:tRNA (adenosine(37)-N6)-threonylcarbamoyltransferase complex transferase subunit TsaD [Coriobacteriia bacterium]